MKDRTHFLIFVLAVLITQVVFAQSHQSNWLHRNMMDTTIVRCWNDSLTNICVPPGSMSMMMPDSMYCRTEFMPMDSLHHPHDSTMIGWCRVMMGSDSMHFNLMNCDSGMINHQMQFMRGLQCRLHWDSLRCDTTRRHWRPTGMVGWDGTSWVSVSGVTFIGNTAIFSTTQLFSAYGFIGTPSNPTGIGQSIEVPSLYVLKQNYPNPFNPSTTISFNIPAPSKVTLTIYNLLGQEVASLVQGDLAVGEHSVVWGGEGNAGNGVPSGIYFYELRAAPVSGGSEFTSTRPMVLVK